MSIMNKLVENKYPRKSVDMPTGKVKILMYFWDCMPGGGSECPPNLIYGWIMLNWNLESC